MEQQNKLILELNKKSIRELELIEFVSREIISYKRKSNIIKFINRRMMNETL